MSPRLDMTSGRRWLCSAIPSRAATIILILACLQILGVLYVITNNQHAKDMIVSNNGDSTIHSTRTRTITNKSEAKAIASEISKGAQVKQTDASRTTISHVGDNVNTSRPYEEIMAERNNCIKDFCNRNKMDMFKRYPNFESLRAVLLGYDWMSSPPHQLFYCATPKCGSTTWKTYILQDRKISWNTPMHEFAIGVLGATKLAEGMTLTKFLEIHRPYNRLVFVRNPWARLLSAYQDKIVQVKWPLQKMCYAAHQFAGMTVTFKVFLQCLAASRRDKVWEPHVNPFTSLCGFCYMEYNMVVKLEEMAEADSYIRNRLNLHYGENTSISLNKGHYKNTYSEYYKDLPKELIASLQDIYKDDISMFGYPPLPIA